MFAFDISRFAAQGPLFAAYSLSFTVWIIIGLIVVMTMRNVRAARRPINAERVAAFPGKPWCWWY